MSSAKRSRNTTGLPTSPGRCWSENLLFSQDNVLPPLSGGKVARPLFLPSVSQRTNTLWTNGTSPAPVIPSPIVLKHRIVNDDLAVFKKEKKGESKDCSERSVCPL